jgi:hypothetical protein
MAPFDFITEGKKSRLAWPTNPRSRISGCLFAGRIAIERKPSKGHSFLSLELFLDFLAAKLNNVR